MVKWNYLWRRKPDFFTIIEKTQDCNSDEKLLASEERAWHRAHRRTPGETGEMMTMEKAEEVITCQSDIHDSQFMILWWSAGPWPLCILHIIILTLTSAHTHGAPGHWSAADNWQNRFLSVSVRIRWECCTPHVTHPWYMSSCNVIMHSLLVINSIYVDW